MSQQELLTEVVAVLRGLEIDFMLTGSHASSLQGEPRATHDIDLIVRLDADRVPQFVSRFQSDGFYLSEPAVAEAVRTKRMFNLLDVSTGEKVDFWMLTDSPFDQSRFARRQRVDVGDVIIELSTPEDTMLMKLLWSKQCGGSEKQFHDVLRIYELQADVLDRRYVGSWAKLLHIEDLWQRVLTEADPFIPPEGST